jgi:hypothetical protein
LVINPVVKIDRKQALTYRVGKSHSELEIAVSLARSRLESQDLRAAVGRGRRRIWSMIPTTIRRHGISGNFIETQAARD